ncbi:MAG: MazG family protein, partial [Acidimicrobiales bacterium]
MVVVGLGPAGPELLTLPATEALARCDFVRTRRHPAAGVLAPDVASFDHLYESAPSMEDVYAGIVEALVDAAARHGEVVYAVPGSPLVLERSVSLLRADDRVEVSVVAGMSFLDLAWARLAVDPVAAGVRLVDGEAFGVDAAGERGPLLVAQCWSREVLSGIKLAVESPPLGPVTVLRHLGLPDEAVFELRWADLDRAVEPDHLTSLWIPALAAPVGVELARLVELVRTLRQRCPWDREQTHASLGKHLIEEAYEVVEAIDGLAGGEGFEHLEEELGDLLVQVCFHSTLAAEQGQFNLADVASGVHDKLVGRHPHVFGSVTADSASQVASNWEQIKQVEKGRASVMDGIPAALPALLAADKVLGKAAAVGADGGGADGGGASGVGAGGGGASEALAALRAAVADLGSGSGVLSPRTGVVEPRYTRFN